MSATVRAIGPLTPIVPQAIRAGQPGTRPGDGRNPTTLLNEAGLRSDPPMSLPSPIGCMPQASAAAVPPLLPPALFDRSYGFLVAPNSGLNVCDPAPNSGTLVLPIVITPARRIRSMTSASSAGHVVRPHR